ncbi:MAG: polysaccharide deacetylase family protein [Hydrogenibacillus sp.]|nr:polysaccharide deacetylase family protein [Hydrogenibacillus sp.]
MRWWVILSWKKTRRRLAFAALVFLSALFLYSEREAVSVFHDRPYGAVTNVPTEERRVALTFDISWGEREVKRVLDALFEADIRGATFFLTGEWARAHPQFARSIARAGYEIGTLGMRPMSFTRLTEEQMKRELEESIEAIHAVTGRAPVLFRPPNGDVDRRVLTVAGRLDLVVVLWDVNPDDWKHPGVETIVERVRQNIRPGSIVLLHASDAAHETPEALLHIARTLKRSGYACVTVSELIRGYQGQAKLVE